MKRSITLFVLLFLLALHANGQSSNSDETPEYVKMMKSRANVNEIKRSFEAYSRQQIAKGNLNPKNNQPYGWKQFKRWEYWWEPRTFPSGNFPEPGIEWKEIQNFNESNTATAAITSSWSELGPKTWGNITGHWAPGIGRINVIVAAPNDPSTLYIGAPAGGLWKTTNQGNTWTPLTDNIPSMGVSAIAIHPNNPNIILIGTGDRDAWDTFGVGILKTTNGGLTWTQTNLNWEVSQQHSCARMIVNPAFPDVVLAGTTDGLYRSEDFGNTWTKVLNGDIDDLELKPNNPNFVYTLVSKTFYRSTDGGLTFTKINQSSTRRAQIAVTPAAPNNVYFYSKNGLFVSTNSGESFSRGSRAPTEGTQDWYDLAIAVSPVNPNIIHVGEIETYRTSNGGKSWTKLTNWYYPDVAPGRYTHCDVHELVYINNILFQGSDGLITYSNDGLNFVDISNGLGIRQFYNIGISQTDPNKFGGGSQDNGTYVYTPGMGWHGWLGADGFEFIIAPDNLVVYGTSQYGTFYKSNTGGSNRLSITQPGGGAWNTPFVMHPTEPNTLFVGNNTGVRKTTNGMGSWTTIGNFNPAAINDLAVAKSNPAYLYASVKERIWVTKNGGSSWSEITTGLPGRFITDIAIDPTNPQRVAVTCSGYSSGNKVFISSNAGTTWTNVSTNLPNLPANAAVFHENAGLYVGMDVGIFYLPDGTMTWQGFMSNLPNVPITELEIQYQSSKLRAATYGRGVWESPLATPANVMIASSSPAPVYESNVETPSENEDSGIVSLHPNPADHVMHVSFTSHSETNTVIQIVEEMTGRTFALQEIIAEKGENTYTFNISSLKSGIYILRISGAVNRAKRFQVKK